MMADVTKIVKKVDTGGSFPPGFLELLGQFHAIWLLFDPQLDHSIGDLLKIGVNETHLLVSGMQFGQKLRFLAELLKRSNHPRKDILIEQIATLQTSKRDMITHAYFKSNRTNFTFMYRARGAYKSGELEFHLNDFANHVGRMVEATRRYHDEYGASISSLMEFAAAIRNM